MNRTEFEIFARDSRTSLLRTAQQIVGSGDEAEDVVQEALLKLYLLRERLKEYRSPKALARVVVRHIALNYLRERRRHPLVDIKEWHGSEAEEEVLTQERVAEVLEAMRQLPEKQQIVLRMRHVEGMDSEDIAEVAQMSIEAVYQNLSRARRAVLEEFKKRGKL